jgi:glycosyltransferase involved in cell wall biosynthesis
LGGAKTIVTSRRSLHVAPLHRHQLYALTEKIIRAGGNWVVANSEAVRHETLRLESLPSERVFLVRNGVDLQRFDLPFDRQSVRTALGVRPDDQVICMVANLIYYKGHQYVLEAIRTLVGRYPRLVLLLAGAGLEETALRRFVDQHDLAQHVRFLGSRRDIPSLLRASDAGLLYSDQEGFPNAILEAMAAGLPVVASHVGGCPEAVVDGVTGCLVPPADPLALARTLDHLIQQPVRAHAFGQAGRQRVETHFSMQRMIGDLQNVYLRILGR